MRRALVACMAIALGAAPVGVLLVLRRMSLVGDAMSHAILPGAAAGFLLAGFSLMVMSLGGFLAGLAVALLAGLVTRFTEQREDASFAAVYLIALAAGVLLISSRGSSMDLMHVLFGSILAVDDASLLLVASVTTTTLLVLAVIYRPLVAECFDPGFVRAVGGGGLIWHLLFMVLVVMNLVSGFHALGTLMSVGLMMVPAVAARYWAGQVWSLMAVAMLIGMLSGVIGLLGSYHGDYATGPAIILTAGAFYIVSVLFGPRGGLQQRLFPRSHLEA
ncbi:MAG: metal ABC transporter permease [Ectothiorhodospiraceae bacterium]|nr:metal ABC transporter permease [Ectothiorhodospiraceae bacterium]